MSFKEDIEEKFNKAQDALVLQQSDLSLGSIAEMVADKSIDISPKYQRRERWNNEKESGLIESFLLNIPVPPVYLAEDEYGTYSVIDGKQRITAIYRFLYGKLRLEKLEKFPEIEGKTFRELPSRLQNALKIRPYLRVVILLRQSDSDLKHEVFLRLNKGGVPLNSQEIRNVAFRGPFNDMLMELSENPYFRSQLRASKNSRVYREMEDVKFVLRFFTVREYWKDFPGNMDRAMDAFMREKQAISQRQLSNMRKSFSRSLEACESIWGDQAFRKPGGTRKVLQGFFDIQMVGLSLLSDNEINQAVSNKNKIRESLKNETEGNKNFLLAATQFTSNPENVRYRIERAVNIFGKK